MEQDKIYSEMKEIHNELKRITKDICDFAVEDPKKHERLFKEKFDFEKFAIELKLKYLKLFCFIL